MQNLKFSLEDKVYIFDSSSGILHSCLEYKSIQQIKQLYTLFLSQAYFESDIPLHHLHNFGKVNSGLS